MPDFKRTSAQGYIKKEVESYFEKGNIYKKWWAWQGLNLRHLPCKGSALPLSYTPEENSRMAKVNNLKYIVNMINTNWVV